MGNDNLPANIDEGSKLFHNIEKLVHKSFIYKRSVKLKNREIIDKFKLLKEYDVLSMPAFKMITDEMIKKDPKGTVIMADINDLFIANNSRGKENVNPMIKNILDKTKNILKESECSDDYQIGKMGDEIYIYMPDKDEIASKEIIDKIHCIHEKELSLSAGMCSDFSKGIINAMNKADEDMCIYKKAFKENRLKETCGNNLENIIKKVVTTHIDKMRLNLKKLEDKNKSDLRNTYQKAVAQTDIEKITTEIEHKNESTDKKNVFEMLNQKYTDEGKTIFGDNDKLVKEYVLASMISKHPVDGVTNNDYFQGLGYMKSYNTIKKDKKNKDFDMLAIDLSGLKTINDTLGHEEGDNAINSVLEHLRNTLADKKVKKYSDIVAKSGGNSYVLIEKLTNNLKDELLNEIEKYGTDPNYKYNLSILCSVQTIDKDNLNKDNFKSSLDKNLAIAECNLENQSLERKILDVEQMKHAIKKAYEQVKNMDDIKLISNSNSEQKEEVLKMIQSGFKDCIENKSTETSINTPSKIIDINREHSNKENDNRKKVEDSKNSMII